MKEQGQRKRKVEGKGIQTGSTNKFEWGKKERNRP